MRYKEIEFQFEDEDNISIKELEKFIENAEIIITNYGFCFEKSDVVVEDSGRGAVLKFNDNTYSYGYHIKSKLIKYD